MINETKMKQGTQVMYSKGYLLFDVRITEMTEKAVKVEGASYLCAPGSSQDVLDHVYGYIPKSVLIEKPLEGTSDVVLTVKPSFLRHLSLNRKKS